MVELFEETNWKIFHRLSQLHFASFDLINKSIAGKKDKGLKIILFYHLLRSLELLLKSFLIYKGNTRSRVKKIFEHNLSTLVDATKFFGLEIDSKDIALINYLNTYYHGKEFEYISFKTLTLPSMNKIKRTVLRMFRLIEPILLNKYQNRSN